MGHWYPGQPLRTMRTTLLFDVRSLKRMAWLSSVWSKKSGALSPIFGGVAACNTTGTKHARRGKSLLYDLPIFIVFIAKSKSLFLDVVHIQPSVHHATRGQMLMDVTFQKFLDFLRHVAQARFTDPIIPFNNFDSRMRCGVLRNPGCDGLIVGTRGNKRPE